MIVLLLNVNDHQHAPRLVTQLPPIAFLSIIIISWFSIANFNLSLLFCFFSFLLLCVQIKLSAIWLTWFLNLYLAWMDYLDFIDHPQIKPPPTLLYVTHNHHPRTMHPPSHRHHSDWPLTDPGGGGANESQLSATVTDAHGSQQQQYK